MRSPRNTELCQAPFVGVGTSLTRARHEARSMR